MLNNQKSLGELGAFVRNIKHLPFVLLYFEMIRIHFVATVSFFSAFFRLGFRIIPR